jgi:hypothetical protein
MARPKPERIPSILKHCAHHLNWDREKQAERTGIGLVKSGWVKFDQSPVKSN